MPNSLRAKISSLRYKGKITEEEYKDLISKLDGHDKALRTPWIPCSKRMPEHWMEVLATTTWGDVTMAMYHPDDTWSIHEGNTNATNEDILAWMPKPERYKKEGE